MSLLRYAICIAIFLLSHSVDFYVNSYGGNDYTCTSTSAACTTISSVLDLDTFTSDTNPTVTLYNAESDSLRCTITQTVTITPYSSYSPLSVYPSTVQSNALITVTPLSATSADVTATLKDLRFSISYKTASSTTISSPLFKVEKKRASSRMNAGDATLTFNNVSLSSSSSILVATYLIEASNGKLVFKDVSFSDIYLSATPLLHVDVATAGAFSIESEASFSRIKRSGNYVGAVVDVDLTSKTSSLDLTGASFQKCGNTESEDRVGGAIKVKLGSDGGTFVVSSSNFDDYSSSSFPQYAAILFDVSDIKLLQKDGKYDVTSSLSLASAGTNDEEKYYVRIGSGEYTPLVYYLASPDGTMYISTDTHKEETCGWKRLPCGPFETYMKTQGSYELLEGEHKGKEATLTGDLSITGTTAYDEETEESSCQTTLTVTNTVKFVTGKYALYLQSLIVAGDSTSWSASFIDASGGELSLKDVQIKSITLANKPLITLTASSKYASSDGGNVFKDILRSAAEEKKGGSVFEISWINSENGISLHDTEFDNCKTTNGYGGAVYLGFTGVPILTFDGETFSSVELYSLTFSNIPSDAAAYGKCIYFDCSQLQLDDIKEVLYNVMSLSPQKEGTFMFQAKDGDKGTDVLNVYSLFQDSLIVIDTTDTAASAGKECGSYSQPCSSFAAAVDSDKFSRMDEDKKEYVVESITLLPSTHKAETANAKITRDIDISGVQEDEETKPTVALDSISGVDYVFTIAASDKEFTVSMAGIAFESSQDCTTGLFQLTKTGEDKTKIATLSLSLVKISNEKSVTYTHPLIDAQAGVLILSDVSFSHILLEDSPLLRINTATGAFTHDKDCSFSKIVRKKGSGAIIAESLTASSLVSLSSSLRFDGCECSSGVGLIYFTLPAAAPTQRLIEVSLSSSSSSFSPDPTSCFIALQATSISHVFGEAAKVFSPLDLKLNEYKYYGVIGSGTAIRTAALSHFLSAPPAGASLYITTATDNDDKCGWLDIPCGPFTPHVKTEGAFTLLQGTHTAAARTLTASLSLSGYTPSSHSSDEQVELPSLAVTKDVQFAASSYTLSLEDLKIIRAQNWADLTASLITSAATGHIHLSDVEFSSLALNGAPLIASSSFSLSDVVFSSITRSDAGSADTAGASVFIFDNINTDSSLPLDGASFISCEGTQNGLGGAVYIKLTALPSSLSFGTLPFRGDVTKAAKGKYMYMDISALTDEQREELVDVYKRVLKGLIRDTTDGLFVVKDAEGEEELYRLLEMAEQKLTVSASCGGAEKCGTLQEVLAKIAEDGTYTGNTITLADSVSLTSDDAMTITKGVEIKGAAKRNSLTIDDNLESSLFSIEQEEIDVSISNINTKIMSSDSISAITHSVVSLTSPSTLSLTDMDFASGVETNGVKQACHIKRNSLIQATAGSLTLTRTTFSSITIDRSGGDTTPLLDINTGRGGFKIAESASFTDITSTSGDSTVFYLSSSSSETDIVLEHASFTQCKALNGDGGVLSGTVSPHGSFILRGCSFDGCQAGTADSAKGNTASTGNRGGAMKLEVSGEPTVVLQDISFKNCLASAANGGNVLYLIYDVEDGQSVPDSFWKQLMSGVSGASADDFVAVIRSPEGQSDPISLSQYQKEDDDDDGFPTWAIIVIVIGAVLIIAVVVLVLVYIFVLRPKQKVGVEENEMKETDNSEEGRNDNKTTEEEEKQPEASPVSPSPETQDNTSSDSPSVQE